MEIKIKIKIKTGTAWGLLAALLLLTTQVEASTVSSVTNSTVNTGQIFSLDLLSTGFTGIVDGGGLNLSFNLFGFNSPLFSAKNSRMGRAKTKSRGETHRQTIT